MFEEQAGVDYAPSMLKLELSCTWFHPEAEKSFPPPQKKKCGTIVISATSLPHQIPYYFILVVAPLFHFFLEETLTRSIFSLSILEYSVVNVHGIGGPQSCCDR